MPFRVPLPATADRAMRDIPIRKPPRGLHQNAQLCRVF